MLFTARIAPAAGAGAGAVEVAAWLMALLQRFRAAGRCRGRPSEGPPPAPLPDVSRSAATARRNAFFLRILRGGGLVGRPQRIAARFDEVGDGGPLGTVPLLHHRRATALVVVAGDLH